MTDKSRIISVNSDDSDPYVKSSTVSCRDMYHDNLGTSIRASHIDKVDELNRSGTLEGLTFYQGPEPSLNVKKSCINKTIQHSGSFVKKQLSKQQAHDLEKTLEQSLLDSESDDDRPENTRDYVEKIIRDNEMIGSVLITAERLYDPAEKQQSKPYDLSKSYTDLSKSHTNVIQPSIDQKQGPKSAPLPMTQMTKRSKTRSSSMSQLSVANLVSNLVKSRNHVSPTIRTDDDSSVKSSVGLTVESTMSQEQKTPDDVSVDASIIMDSDNVNLLYYSHFFELDDKHKKIAFSIKDLIREMCIVLFFHLFLGIHNAIFNVITIDGIVSCLIFYMNFIGVEDKNNFLQKNRLMTLDRYIYYLLLFCGYYLFNYMTWYIFTGFAMYAASIMICPSIMGQIYDIYAYKKIRQVLYDGYNRLVQKIICKQLSKIINIVIKNVLNINVVVGYEDLIPFYNQFSWLIINKFIVTFILACIFNHVDKGSMKFPMMIYKNLYMKDGKYNIVDDKLYLKRIIEDKQYAKFMDVYTLNRIIRMIVADDTQNSMLSEQVTTFLQKLLFRFNRVMFCWTLMSISNLTIGILGFLMFISMTERPMRYLINTMVFTILSFFTIERLLVIVLCEICYPIVDSKLLTDVCDDTYTSLKKGFLHLYYRTRLESVLLSIGLTYLSYCAYNNIGIVTVCVLNLIVMCRLYLSTDFLMDGTVVLTESRDDKILLLPKLSSESEINVNNTIQLTSSEAYLWSSEAYPRLTGELTKNEGDKKRTDTNEGTISLYDSAFEFEEALKSSCSLNYEKDRSKHQKQPKIITRLPTKIDNARTVTKGIKTVAGVNVFDITSIDQDALMMSNSITHPIESVNDLQNKDILLIIRDRIKVVFRNNLLIRTINPFKKVENQAMLRIFAHLFLLLLLGYISNFGTLHIILLPVMIQNVIDILF